MMIRMSTRRRHAQEHSNVPIEIDVTRKMYSHMPARTPYNVTMRRNMGIHSKSVKLTPAQFKRGLPGLSTVFEVSTETLSQGTESTSPQSQGHPSS